MRIIPEKADVPFYATEGGKLRRNPSESALLAQPGQAIHLVFFAERADSGLLQARGRHAVADSQSTAEAAVVDCSAAAGRAALLEYSTAAAVELSGAQGPFCAVRKSLCPIHAVPVDDAFTAALTGRARRRQSAQLLGADGDQRMRRCQMLDPVDVLAVAGVSCG